MPINVFCKSSSSHGNGNRSDTSLFAIVLQKPDLRSNYLEADVEEDINMKNHFRSKNLPDLISIREAASNNYVDNKFNDPSKIKNTDHVDFNDKGLDNVRFVKVNSIPTLKEQLTPKIYVDQTISDDVDNSSSLRLYPDEKLKLDEQDSIVLDSFLTLPKTIIKLPTKSDVDKKINDLSMIKNTAHVDFNDENLDNVRFVKVKSIPAVREHLTLNFFVDQAISYRLDGLSFIGLDPDEKLKLDEQGSIVPNSTLTSTKTIIDLHTKSYVDSSYEICKIYHLYLMILTMNLVLIN